MGQQGYLLTETVETEIVSAYAASLQKVPAVTVAPGWFKVGSFYLPKSLKRTRLDLIGNVSSGGLTMTARLYDPTFGVEAPVSGTDVLQTSTTSTRVLSAVFPLQGGRVYFILAQVVGGSGEDKFGYVDTTSLVGP